MPEVEPPPSSQRDQPSVAAEPLIRTPVEEDPNSKVAQATVVQQQYTEKRVKVAFAFALILGIIAAGLDNWVVPALVVLGYAGFGYALTRHDKSVERFADSLYYMGFLFTIWGLFFAFGPFADNLDNLSSQTIITQFGIKLITTVVALTARIVIIQARSSIHEQIEEPQEAIAELVQKMASEINRSVLEFRRATDQMREQAEKVISDSHSGALESIKCNQENFIAQNQQLLGGLNQSVSDLLAKLKAIDIPQDVLADRIRGAAEAIAKDLDGLRKKLAETNSAISDGLGESLANVRQSTQSIASAMDGLNGFRQVANQAQENLKSLENVNATYSNNVEKTTKLLGDFAAILTSLHSVVVRDVDSLDKGISSATAEIEKVSTALADGVRRLREEVEAR